MRKRIARSALFLLLVFTTTTFYGQLPQVMLTENAKISLLTCSQGDELYSVFGHSAIRVVDPMLGIDWVFNYGTFDFSDPKFYQNFVKGKLNYILSVSTYDNFEYTYIFEGREIYEQVMNLKQIEKQQLLDSLSLNYLPQNRYYLYDFLFDNCATRIRDIVVETLEREVTFDYQLLEPDLTFRQLLMPNVAEKPWAKLGINMLLGVSADRLASPWDYMFLPEHMEKAFATATIGVDSTLHPLTQPSVTLLEGNGFPKAIHREAPFLVFTVVLIMVVFFSWVDFKKRRITLWMDWTLFLIVGLLGVVLAFQWFGSDHAVMSNNYNLIWAHPLHLLALAALLIKPLRNASRYYFGVHAIIFFFLLVFWFFLPQTLPLPMLPVVGALGIRSAILFKYLK